MSDWTREENGVPSFTALTSGERPWRSFLLVVLAYQFPLHHHSVSSREHSWCQPEYNSLSVRRWHKHVFNTARLTHTHGHRDAGSMSCEWWSVGMRGWGIGKWLAWRIKGLHDNQARTSCLTETSLKWTVRRIQDDVRACVCVCLCVCVREREINPWNRQRPVSRMMCFLRLRSFCPSVSLSSSPVSDLSLRLCLTHTYIQVEMYVHISEWLWSWLLCMDVIYLCFCQNIIP